MQCFGAALSPLGILCIGSDFVGSEVFQDPSGLPSDLCLPQGPIFTLITFVLTCACVYTPESGVILPVSLLG